LTLFPTSRPATYKARFHNFEVLICFQHLNATVS
ncbi:hypothetical protein Gotri_009465, partial [Gossypium trilobum]|nr:hypothetical protein [Gossypium trilobum]